VIHWEDGRPFPAKNWKSGRRSVVTETGSHETATGEEEQAEFAENWSKTLKWKLVPKVSAKFAQICSKFGIEFGFQRVIMESTGVPTFQKKLEKFPDRVKQSRQQIKNIFGQN
jgi:hypothetical protein